MSAVSDQPWRAQPSSDPDPERLAAARAALAAGLRAASRVGPGSEPGATTPVDEEVRRAVAFVVRSTNQRPQSVAEVRAKLAGRGYAAQIVETGLAQAADLGAVDDAALARALVDEWGYRRGHGRARIRRDLARRQIPASIVDEALTALDERDDEAAATALARSRLRHLPATLSVEAVARRLVGYLTRRGHPPGLAQRVAARVSGLDRAWD